MYIYSITTTTTTTTTTSTTTTTTTITITTTMRQVVPPDFRPTSREHKIQEFPRRDSKPRKRLQENRAMLRNIVCDVWYCPVFSESLLGFGASSRR